MAGNLRALFLFADRSRSVLMLTVLALLCSMTGCQHLGLDPIDFEKLSEKLSFSRSSPRSQSPEEDDDEFEDELTTKVEVPMVGDYTTFTGLHRVVLEGVGLVVGLNGTGGDPPPSTYREALVDDMRRRDIREWKEIIRSPDTALVVVRAYLPPLISKGEKFDVEVRIPGETGARSLNGGRLMETILSETAMVPGQGVLKGHVVAKARGPILISPEEGDAADLAGVLKRGRVLGGGTSMIDRDMALYVKTDYRTYRNITRLADKIGKRFFAYNEYGLREPLAKAQTDQRILLKVLPRYKDNYPRYLQVVQNIAFRESAVSRRVRLKRLERDLRMPERSQQAALELEAIGEEAIPVLRTGLKSDYLECRFHAATALAYLQEPDGVEILREAAQEEPAFRVFAYAALSIIENPEAHMALRHLMNVNVGSDGKKINSAETRYGAFRALWTLDPNDPFIAGELLRKEFWLHSLETTGSPMIHITQRKRAEIVLFGREQRFQTPMAVRAGPRILVTSHPGSGHVVVSRFTPYGDDKRKVVSKKIEDVIRAVTKLGASYPDVAQMLVQADRQGNIPGRFEIDALPQAGRVFYRDGEKARLGRSTLTPNLYERDREDKESDSDYRDESGGSESGGSESGRSESGRWSSGRDQPDDGDGDAPNLAETGRSTGNQRSPKPGETNPKRQTAATDSEPATFRLAGGDSGAAPAETASTDADGPERAGGPKRADGPKRSGTSEAGRNNDRGDATIIGTRPDTDSRSPAKTKNRKEDSSTDLSRLDPLGLFTLRKSE